MQRLSDKTYDQQKLNELEKRNKRGELDATEVPYLEYLRGDHDRPETDFTYHKKAHELLSSLGHSARKISKVTSRISKDAIQDLMDGNFTDISESYASCIYYKIRSALNKGKL